jgi:hypothetical protein
LLSLAGMTTTSTTDPFPLDDAPTTVLDALRDPEGLLRAWRDHGTRAYPTSLFTFLLGVTAAATAAYGLTMGLPLGWRVGLERAVTFTLAAGAAWIIALPTLYIAGNILGHKLEASTTVLAATLTVHYGSLAMLASIPIHLLFAAVFASSTVTFGINLVIFTGVGLCASDVLLRSIDVVDPTARSFAIRWLVLLGVLGAELFSLAGIFRF